VTQEVLMSMANARQGELFTPPAPQPELPQEAYQRMLRLLARMMNEHLHKNVRPSTQAEVADE
jgi:hypothetical protein